MSSRLSAAASRQPLVTGDGSLLERMRNKLEASRRAEQQKDYLGAMVVAQCALEDALHELERSAR